MGTNKVEGKKIPDTQWNKVAWEPKVVKVVSTQNNNWVGGGGLPIGVTHPSNLFNKKMRGTRTKMRNMLHCLYRLLHFYIIFHALWNSKERTPNRVLSFLFSGCMFGENWLVVVVCISHWMMLFLPPNMPNGPNKPNTYTWSILEHEYFKWSEKPTRPRPLTLKDVSSDQICQMGQTSQIHTPGQCSEHEYFKWSEKPTCPPPITLKDVIPPTKYAKWAKQAKYIHLVNAQSMNILSEVKRPPPLPPQTRKSIESEEKFIHNMKI
jgi:hypothetical protein